MALQFAFRFPCVTITPLGAAVEPEVNCRKARSGSSIGARSSLAPAGAGSARAFTSTIFSIHGIRPTAPQSTFATRASVASTIPIMGAPCKGSRWRPSSHDFSAPALGWGAGAARRLAIAVHAVLSRRAFVVVAALERGVHVFADAARADETLGAVRGVAALRRDAALADAGVGAACGSEQEQERESHGSPVLPDARGAVSVTWRRRFHRGSSRATLLRGEGARTNTPTIPARNPPTCAHQATPPVPSATLSEATPESNCMPNQKSR